MDKLLSTLDRVASQFGSLDALLNCIVAWVVPQTAASACGPVFCGFGCRGLNNVCSKFDHAPSEVHLLGDDQNDCNTGDYNCIVWDGNCCY